MLDALEAALADRGFRDATTAHVAARAGVSKESLYSWFGDEAGLVAALVRRNAAATNAQLEQALAGRADEVALRGLARDPLTLLVGPSSVMLNRLAMGELPGNPALGGLLLENGRHTTGPLAEAFLARCAQDGGWRVEDPAHAFRMFYGLVVADAQIRVLLGEPPPTPARIAETADRATDDFLRLVR